MDFLDFFLVLLAAVFFSEIFRRLHLPWVIALIVGGIIIGPFGLDWVEVSGPLEFMGEIGVIFLMFMAGLETRSSDTYGYKKGILILALLNSLVPFLVGYGIAYAFGMGFYAQILLGIIFISTSIAVIVPTFEAGGLLRKPIGKSVVASAVIEDITSLLLLSIILQVVEPIRSIPLPLFFFLLVLFLVVFRWAIPKIKWIFAHASSQDLFQQELRTIFAILIGVVVIFELIGVHGIIAGFFAGWVLSGSINSEIVREKLRVISYGVFIPTFFIVLGAKTDLGALVSSTATVILTVSIVLGLVSSKFVSGWAGARIAGLKQNTSAMVGFATIPQLSTTLAVAFTAREFGIITNELTSSLIVLSLVTVILSPLLVKFFQKRMVQRGELSVSTEKIFSE